MEEFSLTYLIQVAGAVLARIAMLLVKFLPIVIIVVAIIVFKRSWDKRSDEKAAAEYRRKHGGK